MDSMGVVGAFLELVKEFKDGVKRGYSSEVQSQQQTLLLNDFKVNIGKYEEGSNNIQWSPFEDGSHKIALIGSHEKRNKVFMNIERQIREVQEVGFFKINFPGSSMLGQQGTLSNILSFEKTPANEIPNETLASHRQYFVDLYIKLICDDLNINVSELKADHFPAQEGPLMGYVRASEHLNEDIKEKFMAHINALDHIIWGNENDLFEFEAKSNGDHNKEFLEFVKGIWSFWVYSMISFTEEFRVVCVEVPTTLYDESHGNDLDIMLGILEDIASLSKITIILTSDSVEPIKQREIRYKCIVNNNGRDYDFTSSSLEFNDEGNSFILVDDTYKEKNIGKLM